MHRGGEREGVKKQTFPQFFSQKLFKKMLFSPKKVYPLPNLSQPQRPSPLKKNWQKTSLSLDLIFSITLELTLMHLVRRMRIMKIDI
jgi:hypothetical protein